MGCIFIVEYRCLAPLNQYWPTIDIYLLEDACAKKVTGAIYVNVLTAVNTVALAACSSSFCASNCIMQVMVTANEK